MLIKDEGVTVRMELLLETSGMPDHSRIPELCMEASPAADQWEDAVRTRSPLEHSFQLWKKTRQTIADTKTDA